MQGMTQVSSKQHNERHGPAALVCAQRKQLASHSLSYQNRFPPFNGVQVLMY
jgi:hypothetical protein